MACAVGNPGGPLTSWTRVNRPFTQWLFDFAACGHALCIVDSRASHADLTDEYTAITRELKAPVQLLRQGRAEPGARIGIFTLPFPPYAPCMGTGQFCGPFTSTRRISGCPEQVAALEAGDF